jgi:glycerol-3-phosphate dehydrogenase
MGCATTAASTHLIHGGLRYLLYDRPTTITTCWDSGNIVRIARSLLTRLPIIWPVYHDHGHGMETVETLLEAYDRLSPMKEGRPHLRLSAKETLRLFPALKREGLVGAVSFDEWWVDPVALVKANIASAKSHGAEANARTSVTDLILEGKRVAGVRVKTGDRNSRAYAAIQGSQSSRSEGNPEEIRASITINASGPWADRVASMAGLRVPLRLQKGTHLVYSNPVSCLPRERPIGLILEAEDRERYIFIVASGLETLVGPTDLDGGNDPDRIATDAEEIRYLLASARRYFPDFPERFSRTAVGARPILAHTGSGKHASREYEVLDHEIRDGTAGFVTVAGGKMSDFRLMAQDAVNLACRRLGKAASCQTYSWTLDGKPAVSPTSATAPKELFAGFLRRHPRLRQWHALSHLGVAFVHHLIRRTFEPATPASLEDFQSHYYNHVPQR